MKKHISILIFILLSLVNIKSFSQENLNSHIINAVEKEMNIFLNEIPDNMLSYYGIGNREILKYATIGNPIPVYNIKNDSCYQLNSWRVPLIINQNYIGLFTVIKNSYEEYEVVDFGASILAKELSHFKEDTSLKGILRVYKLNKDFLYFNNEQDFFTPMQNDKQTKKSYSLDEIISLIKR